MEKNITIWQGACHNILVYVSTVLEYSTIKVARKGYVYVHDSSFNYYPTFAVECKRRKRAIKKAMKLVKKNSWYSK